MKLILKFFNRIRFKKNIKSDESKNVVDSVVKARNLYKILVKQAHPDKHPEKRKIAEDITSRLTCSKYNYAMLLTLKDEIEKKL